jgi:hypothetical protein
MILSEERDIWSCVVVAAHESNTTGISITPLS